MGKAASKLKTIVRPIKNYNVEERAFKVISKEKSAAAPPYPSMEKIMEEIKNDPELLNRGKPNAEDIKVLNQVYIKSQGHNPIIRTKQSHALPELRNTTEDSVYGVEEPAVVPKGQLSLRQILSLMEKYQQDKEKNSPEDLAKEFNVDPKVTVNLLEYFRPFQVYLPPKNTEETGKMEKFKYLIAKPFKFDKPKQIANK